MTNNRARKRLRVDDYNYNDLFEYTHDIRDSKTLTSKGQTTMFVKLISNNDITRKELITGLNTNIDGICYCEPKDVMYWKYKFYVETEPITSDIYTHICTVTIPDDAHITTLKHQLRSDKVVLSDPYIFEEHPLWSNIEICKIIVQQNGLYLSFIKWQTEEICLMAVQQEGMAIEYVKELTKEICKRAVQQDGAALCYIKDQTVEICKLSVQQDGTALKYVNEQTEEICKIAVQQNGMALQYVNEQTAEICRLAVQQDGRALQYVLYKFFR